MFGTGLSEKAMVVTIASDVATALSSSGSGLMVIAGWDSTSLALTSAGLGPS